MGNYLYIVGSATTHVTAPSLAAYTNDIFDVRIKANATWATAGSYNLGGLYGTAGNHAWGVYLGALGKFNIRTSDDGTNTDTDQHETVITDVANNEDLWLRWVWNAGAISYFFSRDTTTDHTAVSWTAHGTDTAAFATIFGSTLELKLARLAGLGHFTGRLQRFVVLTGAGSTVVYDADFTDLTQTEVAAGAFTEDSSNAATITLNGTGWTYVGTPEGVAATADSESQITVSWTDTVGEASYRVERLGDDVWSDISGALAAGTTSYADTGLVAGLDYTYRVVATYTPGDGDPSAEVSARTPGGHAMAWKPMLRPGVEYPEWLMHKMRRHPSQAAALVHAWHRGTLKE